MPALDTYHVIAKYYDGAYAAKQDLVDLPFYVELAEQRGGPVLEIACGTGRAIRSLHGLVRAPGRARGRR